MRIRIFILLIAGTISGLAGCAAPNQLKVKAGAKSRVPVNRNRIISQKDIPLYTPRVIKSYPHAEASSTQGLVMSGEYLYESTGIYDKSRLMKLELESGNIVMESALASNYFGEGVTVLGDKIYQLTYLSNTGFVYDKNSFELIGKFHYSGQGWGLTHDNERIIMSNGSAELIFLNAETLEVEDRILVHDNTGYIGFLNELEYVSGSIYANIWQTDFIAEISPDSGKITGWIDLAGLSPDFGKTPDPHSPNGIAYNEKTGRLLVTGKCWPEIYEIELVPVKGERDYCS